MRRRSTLAHALPPGLGRLALGGAVRLADAALNRVVADRPYRPPSERAAALHRTLRVVDLHDDLLLWHRDPLRRSRTGHTDLPRLADGNVAVQVFSTVTHAPLLPNYRRNAAAGDLVRAIAIASGWPRPTRASRLERALHQARKLHQAAARSGGRLEIVASADALRDALARRESRSGGARTVVGLLSTEGLQALDGRLEAVDVLFAQGFRLVGLAHFADNDAAGSAHGVEKGGLTPLGRAALRRLEERRMIVDLAHASRATVDEVLATATRPVLLSHAGVQALCPGPRNASDEELRRIAAAGGLVGIGFWRGAVRDASPGGIARAVRHAVDVMGAEHVALGSDWDGAVAVGAGPERLPALTSALLDTGLSEDQVRSVMGESALRFLLANLP